MFNDFPEKLFTGIEKIDTQHMELFSRIKKLHESYLNETYTEIFIETFVYIRSYIDNHFVIEEKCMLDLNYPNFDRHLKTHKNFNADYSKLEKLFKKEGFSSDFNLNFNVKIIKWLKDHVLKEDIILADFIHKQKAGLKQ